MICKLISLSQDEAKKLFIYSLVQSIRTYQGDGMLSFLKISKGRAFLSALLILQVLLFQNCSNKTLFSVDQVDLSSTSTNTTSSTDSNKVYLDLLSSGSSVALKQTKAINNAIVKSVTNVGILPLNLGVHMGGISNGAPLIEEYLYSDREKSPWYLAQWKKIRPLRPSLSFETNTSDNFVFKLKNPASNESYVNAFLNSQGAMTYELNSSQGYLTSVGGSNLFLSADVRDRNLAHLNREVNFLFDSAVTKLDAEVYPQYQGQAASLLQRDVSGFYIGGFPVAYNDGNPNNTANVFIQFYISDTRVKNPASIFRYRGFYPHGGGMEIVATLPISDITGNASDMIYSANSNLKNFKINLNTMLCLALNADFNRNDGIKQETINFATAKNGLYMNNLAGWSVGSAYIGMETQATYFDENTNSADYFYPSSDSRYSAHDVRQDIKDRMITNNEFYKGRSSLTVQLANMSFVAEAEPYKEMKTCDDVLKAYGKATGGVDIVTPSFCSANTVTSNGCDSVANGLNQRTCNSNGTAYGSCVLSCNNGYHASGTSCVADVVPASTCSYGSGISNTGTSAFEWMCSCDSSSSIVAKSGWVDQGSGCYHRTADSFCNSNKQLIFYVCDQSSTPSGIGWMPQAGGCYHWNSGRSCN